MGADPVKGNSVVPTTNALDNELVRFRQAYKTAIESKDKHGLKLLAIVTHMRAHGCPGVDEPYLYKLYNGARPLTDQYIVALPDTVNALFYGLLAEQHEGQIVIKPATGTDGVRQFAQGLYGFVQQLAKLPTAVAAAPLKADLRPPKAKTRTAAGGHR